MSKSGGGSFSSAMSLDDHFPEHSNGKGDGKGESRRHKGPKNRNTRARSHKQNGSSSKEQTPTSPPPEDKENQAEAERTPGRESVKNGSEGHLQVPSVTSNINISVTSPSPSKNTMDLTTTTEDDFVTANNSAAEESLNGNFESLPNEVANVKESDEDTQNANTSSTGTLTPNNSFQEDKTNNHVKGEPEVITLDDTLDDEFPDESMAVHPSETVRDPSVFQSFLDSSLSTSPLSASRSAAPDLSTISEHGNRNSSAAGSTSMIYPGSNQVQFQTSTPICASNVPSRRSNGSGSGEMNFTVGEDPSTIYHSGEAPSTIYPEDPTYVARANRAFMDLDDESQNSRDLGQFGATKESGICDMSTPSKDFKDTIEHDGLPKDDDDDTDVGLEQNLSPNNSKGSEEVVVAARANLTNEVPEVNTTESEAISNAEQPIEDEAEAVSDVDEEVEEINKPFLLPTTVTELTASNGVKVYLVGTAHFSRQSQLDVIETMEKVQPSIVVLELCRSRSGMLTMNEEDIMREAADMSLAKIRATIKQTGPVQGLLHVLLLQMTASLTKKLGMAPGGEFRVAVQEAQKIPGCGIHFGDRHLSITLNRALSGLGFFQKVRLAWHFLKANDTDITKEEVEACKEKDLLEKLLVEMAGEFPSITRVLLDERDLYLANSLWLAATSTLVDRAGNIRQNTKPIVGVVGMGHVAGIIRNWGPIDADKMAEIVVIPEPPLSHYIIGKTIKFSLYALLGFTLYKGSRKLFSFPSDALLASIAGQASTTFAKVSTKVTGKL